MSKPTWYSIKAQAGDDAGETSAEIYIFDVIGWWGIEARTFINEVRDLDVDRIDLRLNSPGGDVFDGIAIQNLLKMHKARVVTHIDGLAGSIASIIALAGDEIRIASNAYVMIHNPSSIVWGEADDMLKEAELLDKISDGIAGDYARKMDITVAEARALMDEETWYLGQEAVDAGFADSTYEGIAAAASFDLNKLSNKAPAAAVARFQAKTGKPGTATTSNNKPKTEEPPMGKQAKAGTEAGNTEDHNTKTPAPENAATTPETKPETAAPQPEAKADDKAKMKAAIREERERINGINNLGEKFGFKAEAKKFVDDDKTVADFREHILAKSPDAWRDTLAVTNPTTQNTADDDTTDDADELRAKVQARRKARLGC